tara:strand:- start:9682 stop:9786 length:105 start_codon:yes stop_codon:yes gene_type:complete
MPSHYGMSKLKPKKKKKKNKMKIKAGKKNTIKRM